MRGSGIVYQVVQSIERGFQPAKTSLLSGGKSQTALADSPSEANIVLGFATQAIVPGGRQLCEKALPMLPWPLTMQAAAAEVPTRKK